MVGGTMSTFFSLLDEKINACESLFEASAPIDYSMLINMLGQLQDRISAASDDLVAMHKIASSHVIIRTKLNNMKMDMQKAIRDISDVGKVIVREKEKNN
jgi:hypothetical protein